MWLELNEEKTIRKRLDMELVNVKSIASKKDILITELSFSKKVLRDALEIRKKSET